MRLCRLGRGEFTIGLVNTKFMLIYIGPRLDTSNRRQNYPASHEYLILVQCSKVRENC